MYTPPPGNGVDFNFTASYTAPAGSSVAFDFVVPPPPSGAVPVLFIVA